MERMGELPGRCILLVGEQELQRQRIQEEIALAIRLGNRMHLVQQLELYRELSGDNNRQEQQWLSLGETVLHWWSGGEAVNIEQLLQRILEMSGMPLMDEDSRMSGSRKLHSMRDTAPAASGCLSERTAGV